MVNDLILETGAPVPIVNGNLIIYQPSLKLISSMGEKDFLTGCCILNFSKEKTNDEDKKVLENISDFQYILEILKDKNKNLRVIKFYLFQIFDLIFPNKKILIKDDRIEFIDRDNEQVISFLNESNFKEFQSDIKEIFCLKQKFTDKPNYNPKGDLAAKIAKKLEERHKILEKQQEDKEYKPILHKHMSVLSVGLKIPLTVISDYTLYQLKDEFSRFYDYYLYENQYKAIIAGCTIKEQDKVEHWLKDLSENNES